MTSIRKFLSRAALGTFVASLFFASTSHAQVRQTSLYIDDGSGHFNILQADPTPKLGGTYLFPSTGGTNMIITTANLSDITGGTSFTPGGVFYGITASTMGTTVAGTSGNVLVSGGAGAPTWAAQTGIVNTLSGDVTGASNNNTINTASAPTGNNIVTAIGQGTGVIGVANGGTGAATVGTGNEVFASPNATSGAPGFRPLVDADLPSDLGTEYIQNQNAGPQTTSNFNISGTGTAATGFVAPLFHGADAADSIVTTVRGNNNSTAAGSGGSLTIIGGQPGTGGKGGQVNIVGGPGASTDTGNVNIYGGGINFYPSTAAGQPNDNVNVQQGNLSVQKGNIGVAAGNITVGGGNASMANSGLITGKNVTISTFTTAGVVLNSSSGVLSSTAGPLPLANGGTAANNTSIPNHEVFIGPISSGPGNAGFRPLDATDIPDLSGNYIDNQSSPAQTANFNISGNGTISGILDATGSIQNTTSNPLLISTVNGELTTIGNPTGTTTMPGTVNATGSIQNTTSNPLLISTVNGELTTIGNPTGTTTMPGTVNATGSIQNTTSNPLLISTVNGELTTIGNPTGTTTMPGTVNATGSIQNTTSNPLLISTVNGETTTIGNPTGTTTMPGIVNATGSIENTTVAGTLDISTASGEATTIGNLTGTTTIQGSGVDLPGLASSATPTSYLALNGSNQVVISSASVVSGSGTANTIPIWEAGGATLGDSKLTDDGTDLVYNTAFDVSSSGAVSGVTTLEASTSVQDDALSTAGIVTNTGAGLLGTVAEVPVANGGTGAALSLATGDLITASSSTAFTNLADVATGSVLVSGGVDASPSWSSLGNIAVTSITGTTNEINPVALSTGAVTLSLSNTLVAPGTFEASTSVQDDALSTAGIVTNTGAGLLGTVAEVPVANGGTGAALSLATGDLITASSSTAFTNLADVATGSVLVSGGVDASPSWSSLGNIAVTSITGTTNEINPVALSTGAVTLSLSNTLVAPGTFEASTSVQDDALSTAGIVTNTGAGLLGTVAEVPVANGGTGAALSLATGDLITASSSTAFTNLADVATGSVLVSGGVDASPSWSSLGNIAVTSITGTTNEINPVALSTGAVTLSLSNTLVAPGTFEASTSVQDDALSTAGIVTNTGAGLLGTVAEVPVANGGTGAALSLATGDLITASSSTAFTNLADVATGSVLVSGGVDASPSWSSLGNIAVTSITGTTNEINPVALSTGAVTLSLSNTLVAPGTFEASTSVQDDALSTAGIVTNTGAGLLGTVAEVPVANGGTGAALSLATGDLITASSSTAFTNLADVATGSVLVSGGVDASPSWSSLGNIAVTSITGTTNEINPVALSTGAVTLSLSNTLVAPGTFEASTSVQDDALSTAGIVTNTGAGLLGTVAEVPVANGGTGAALSLATGDLITASSSTAFTNLADVATGSVLVSGGVDASPSWSSLGNIAVTSITGTTNEINPVALSTGAVTLSLSNTLVAPGTFEASTSVQDDALSTAGIVTNTGAGLLGTVAEVPVANGGTGAALSLATGDLITASSSTAFTNLADVATGSVLVSGGVDASPSWSSLGNIAVTSITGTTNEINPVALSTGAVTLSLPTTLVAPGTFEATTSMQDDGLTTAGIVTNTAGGALGTETLVPLANGGTDADLSGQGGPHEVLEQFTNGGAVTVAQLANTDITGLGTMSTQDADAVAITGGSITGTTISGSTGSFTTLTSTGNSTIGTAASTTNTFGNGGSATNSIGDGASSSNTFGSVGGSITNSFGDGASAINTFGIGASASNTIGSTGTSITTILGGTGVGINNADTSSGPTNIGNGASTGSVSIGNTTGGVTITSTSWSASGAALTAGSATAAGSLALTDGAGGDTYTLEATTGGSVSPTFLLPTEPTVGPYTLATTGDNTDFVNSINNAASDATLTFAGTGSGPYAGAVTGKLNLDNANTWTNEVTIAPGSSHDVTSLLVEQTATASPLNAIMDVTNTGASTHYLTVDPTGNIGIGMATPSSQFSNFSTGTNIVDPYGTGGVNKTFTWVSNSGGYAATVDNSTAADMEDNGLLVKVANNRNASLALEVSSGDVGAIGTTLFDVWGNGNVTMSPSNADTISIGNNTVNTLTTITGGAAWSISDVGVGTFGQLLASSAQANGSVATINNTGDGTGNTATQLSLTDATSAGLGQHVGLKIAVGNGLTNYDIKGDGWSVDGFGDIETAGYINVTGATGAVENESGTLDIQTGGNALTLGNSVGITMAGPLTFDNTEPNDITGTAGWNVDNAGNANFVSIGTGTPGTGAFSTLAVGSTGQLTVDGTGDLSTSGTIATTGASGITSAGPLKASGTLVYSTEGDLTDGVSAVTVTGSAVFAAVTGTGSGNITVSVTAAPVTGQVLLIYNNTSPSQPLVLNGQYVFPSYTGKFIYYGSQWILMQN